MSSELTIYEVHLNHLINAINLLLQGYILGNPTTDPILDGNSVIPRAYGLGFISDELYEVIQSSNFVPSHQAQR
jgi:hypothetical protein